MQIFKQNRFNRYPAYDPDQKQCFQCMKCINQLQRLEYLICHCFVKSDGVLGAGLAASAVERAKGFAVRGRNMENKQNKKQNDARE